ncbi:MAG: DUF3450 domain-containing protein [Desulfatibacillaceae bacterium]
MLFAVQVCVAETLSEQMEKPVADSVSERRQAQQALEGWNAEKRRMAEEVRSLEASSEDLSGRVSALETEVAVLEAEVTKKERRLAEACRMAGEMEPFFGKGMEAMEMLVEESDPFLMVERRERLGRLRSTLNSPSAAAGEKYRKTMEALFVEAEYGNTVEVYRAELDMEGSRLRMNLLRFGRLALFCQSLDETRYGTWDPAGQIWIWLPPSSAPGLSRAFAMASRRMPLDIVELPLGKVVQP